MEAMRKGFGKKLGTSFLAITMVATTGLGMGLFTNDSYADTASSTQKAIESNYSSVTKTNSGADKSETTYAVMTADGVTKEIDVDETLQNSAKAATIADYSELTNIKNTSGNEKFTKSGNDITWKANGDSITYQGKSSKELPVTVQVSYYLNGSRVTASQIAGKSGKVEIHFDYTVNQKTTADGYTLTHPYTMASGVMLSNEHFSNVTVSNGKNINDGSNSVCLGIAFPGLADDLNISSSQFNIPESVVITADARDFQIDGTYTVAMSGVLNDIDTSKTSSVKSKIAELESGLSSLSSASATLLAGTGKLSAGATKLNNSVQGVTIPSVTLSQAQLDEIGKTAATDSSVTGAATQLYQGMYGAMESAACGAAGQTASSTAKTTRDKTLDAANASAAKAVHDSVYKALTDNGVNAATAEATASAYQKNYADAAAAAKKNDTTDYNAIASAASAATKTAMDADTATQGKISSSVSGAVTKVAAGSAQAGAQGVASQVNTKLSGFSTKFNELKSATAQLSSGASELNTGMSTFNSQGIQKLVSSLSSSQLKEIANRLEATADASKQTVFVGGKTSAMSGESKIIFKTEEVK